MISTGVAIGAGWQSIVAYVNLGCYYIIGIPVGIVLGNYLDLQVKVRAHSPIFAADNLLIMIMLLDGLNTLFHFCRESGLECCLEHSFKQ